MTTFQMEASHKMIDALKAALLEAIAKHGLGSAEHKEVSDRLSRFCNVALER
ncbi:MAG: hypothetical protein P1V51_19685 [Deltaproteobacteria bacterium]|nr:hypothetical protein [Deltaproteobacteria bacterium]